MSEPMLKLSAAARFESEVPAATRGEKPVAAADDEAEVWGEISDEEPPCADPCEDIMLNLDATLCV